MVSWRASIISVLTAGAFSLGCENRTLKSSTIEQHLAQIRTEEGKKQFLLKVVEKGVVDDPRLLNQALEIAATDNPYIAEKIIHNRNYVPLLDIDKTLEACKRLEEQPLCLEFLFHRDTRRAKEYYEQLIQNPRYAFSFEIDWAAKALGDYERAIQILVNHHFYDQAATIALKQLNNPELAIDVYTQGKQYVAAFRIAQQRGLTGKAEEVRAAGLAFFREGGERYNAFDHAEFLELNGQKAEANELREKTKQECIIKKNYQCAARFAELQSNLDEASTFWEMAGDFGAVASIERQRGNLTRAENYQRIDWFVTDRDY